MNGKTRFVRCCFFSFFSLSLFLAYAVFLKPKRAAPTIIDTCLIVREYIPETNDHLTLEDNNLVYVFSKDPKVTGKEGYSFALVCS